MKQLSLIVIALLLTACGTSPKKAQEALAGTLPDPRYVSYRDIESYPGDIVCGEYTAMDAMGNPAGWRVFIYRDNAAYPYPTEDDIYIFCSDVAAERVEETFGIAPMKANNKALLQIRTDLQYLQNALQQYYEDNSNYPTTEQGLTALRIRATGNHSPKVFPEGGYLDKDPLDPWGRVYILETEPFGGVKPSYSLYTLGADGKVGGKGPDADVSTAHLKYLDLL
ncbi:MAG: type II secretion system protein GspG [Halioglobus sp.]